MPVLVRIQLSRRISPNYKIVDLTKSVLLLKHLTDRCRVGVLVAIHVESILPIMPLMPFCSSQLRLIIILEQLDIVGVAAEAERTSN